MTCTADSEYIRAVSVRYRRCPSSYSVRSAVERAGFEMKAERPKTAVEVVPPSVRPRTAQAQREKTQLLEELMFFYGRNVHTSFTFPRNSSPARTQSDNVVTTRASTGSPWNCQNEALRQMYKASAHRPRHRYFSTGGKHLPKIQPKTTSR
ncbi:uncharacterized protein [Littorina saxatilis]|uniref:Uncharacterized protein n=1 Tax=Littorina saxatilis TaxID=31220 RepID=A0AAN9G840_9CAEN